MRRRYGSCILWAVLSGVQPGDTIANEYRLEQQLGSGAFGTVWRATRLSQRREVALRFLKEPQGNAVTRFEHEARALARISHTNCVVIYGSGTTSAGDRYLVMELVEGAPLSDVRGQPVALPEVLEIIRQISAALAAAHAAGVAHRDLKPENVVVAHDRDGVHLKVLDFGLAKLYGLDQVDVTATGEVFGTPQ